MSEREAKYKYIDIASSDGIVQLNMHDGDGGKFVMYGSQQHAELTEVFYELGLDDELRAVILTGNGGAFIDGVDFGTHSGRIPGSWGISTQGFRLYLNACNVPVPMIAVVDGSAHVHAQLVLLCDIVLATPASTFRDAAHFRAGIVPGDSANLLWPRALGPSRARYFLLTGETITAEEAKTLGFVHEILPSSSALSRAWELARDIASRPLLTIRQTRAALIQELRCALVAGMPHGLAAEQLAGTEYWPEGLWS